MTNNPIYAVATQFAFDAAPMIGEAVGRRLGGEQWAAIGHQLGKAVRDGMRR